jgi:hypothetical protein
MSTDSLADYTQLLQGEQSRTQQEGQTVEVGVSGLNVSGGMVLDDFLPELNGLQGRKKYREMQLNDPIVGALLNAIEMMVRAVDFRFEPAEADIDSRYVDFMSDQFDNMTYSWDDTLSEILTMLPFGFSIMEMVFKYGDDGLIRTAKFASRDQSSIWEWDISSHGEVKGVVQWPPYGGTRVYIPYPRILHFKTKMAGNNPEGRSILRNAYKSHYYAKNIEAVEAIAIERELAGLPVMYIPAAALKDNNVRAKYEQIVRDVKKNSQGGLVMPSDPFKDSDGNPTNMQQYRLELQSASGSRSIDTDTVIKRHQKDMVRTVLADFIMLGSETGGSYALSKDKSQLFLRALEGYLGNICSELNRKWIGTLWDLNSFPHEAKPKLVHGRIAPVDLAELGTFARDTGLSAAYDETIENHFREVAGIPARGDGDAIE